MATNGSRSNDGSRIPALDGIRGLAIGLVLMWHGVFFGTDTPNHPHLAHLIALGRLSWSGVDLFFVLSGFLIGGILLDAADAENYFPPFYIRRAHRILPLYAAVLAIAFSVPNLSRHLGAIPLWVDIRVPLISCLTFFQNFWMAKHADFGGTLGPTWSLAVEEQFYLTLPALIRFVPRRRLWWIVGGMITGAPVLRMFLNSSLDHGTFASYVLLPCRADALGLGVIAALMLRTPRVWDTVLRHRNYLYTALVASFLGVAALLLTGFTPFTNDVFGLEYLLLAVFYFLLLLGVLTNRVLEAVLSLRPLRYMGLIAYGLYLLHAPCIAAARTLAAQIHPAQSGWIALSVSLAGVGLATAVAAISWKYLESPLIKRGHRYRYGNKVPPTTPTLTTDAGRAYAAAD